MDPPRVTNFLTIEKGETHVDLSNFKESQNSRISIQFSMIVESIYTFEHTLLAMTR